MSCLLVCWECRKVSCKTHSWFSTFSSFFVCKVTTLQILLYTTLSLCVCVCLSVCVPPRNRFLGNCWSQHHQTGHGNCSDKLMHHMLIILTFIQGHTDFNHENNKCLIISETVQTIPIKFVVKIVWLYNLFSVQWLRSSLTTAFQTWQTLNLYFKVRSKTISGTYRSNQEKEHNNCEHDSHTESKLADG